ncbi:MAG: hypothetical protein Q9212_003265 [Teloschistes hypoglaucus]
MAYSLATPDTKNPSKRASAFDIPHPKRPKPDDSTDKHQQSEPDDEKTYLAKNTRMDLCVGASLFDERTDERTDRVDK